MCFDVRPAPLDSATFKILSDSWKALRAPGRLDHTDAPTMGGF